jgi:hypothetical protein
MVPQANSLSSVYQRFITGKGKRRVDGSDQKRWTEFSILSVAARPTWARPQLAAIRAGMDDAARRVAEITRLEEEAIRHAAEEAARKATVEAEEAARKAAVEAEKAALEVT